MCTRRHATESETERAAQGARLPDGERQRRRDGEHELVHRGAQEGELGQLAQPRRVQLVCAPAREGVTARAAANARPGHLPAAF